MFMLTTPPDKLRKFDFPGLSQAPSAVTNSKKQRQQALAKVASAPLSIVGGKPVRYIYDAAGEIIAEEDVPVVDLTDDNIAASSDKVWEPKNKHPTITIRDTSPEHNDSPPTSPLHDDDSDNTTTPNLKKDKLTATPAYLLNEAEQSSADESSPLERAKANLMTKFRMLHDVSMDGEEADDEASDGARTPNSMGFRDDMGTAVGDDDNGISQNKPDEGIGQRLDNVQIGSKRYVSGDHGGMSSVAKKTKVGGEEAPKQQEEEQIDEELEL